MPIVLVRHGETALNATRVMQPADTPLSPRGQAQAALVAVRLAATPVAAILSSDLPRARLTAAALAARTGRPVRDSALLQERNFGDLRGRPYDTLGFDPLAMAEAPPGGESAAAFAHRVRCAFALLLEQHAGLDGDLVVVTHGLLIRTLLADPLRLPAQIMAGLHLGNTSVSIFDAEPPHALRLLNCTRHLDGATGDDARALSGG
jgi:2,3-bisphosphoglycerate-dependent phosphoglycerate mutase